MAEKRESMMAQAAGERIERAEQLAREAASYWQTTLRGLFALPNATALSLSSAVLYATGIAEQSYRRLEALSGRIGGEITREVGEVTRAATLRERERAKQPPLA
jgi:hypothetical protein